MTLSAFPFDASESLVSLVPSLQQNIFSLFVNGEEERKMYKMS